MKKLYLLIYLLAAQLVFFQRGPTEGARLDQMLYMRGDTHIQLNLGMFFPLFAGGFNFQNISALTLNPGFNIGANVDVHLDNNLKMGGGIVFLTAQGINAVQANFITLNFRTIYEFHVFGWSFPVGGSAGIQIGSYGESFAINPILRPEAGVFYSFNRQWSIGATAAWGITFEPVFNNMNRSRIGNMFEVMLSGRYYFEQ